MTEFLSYMTTDEEPATTEEVLKRYIRENRKLKDKNQRLYEANGRLFERTRFLRFIIKRIDRSREKMRARFFLLFDEKHDLNFNKNSDFTNNCEEEK